MAIVPGDPAPAPSRPAQRVPFSRAAVVAFAAVDARRIRADWEAWRLQSNFLRHCKVANSYPGRTSTGETVHLAHLSEVVNQARLARGNRKMLRRPARPHKAGQRSLFARMNWHLRRVARRALDEWFIHGHDAPAVDDLAAALAALVWSEYSELVYVRAPGGDPLGRTAPRWLDGDDAVRRVAASAARYALPRWNPMRVIRRQLSSAAGGRKSRRGPSKATPANLARLRKLDGLTAAQQAEELGLSVRTVYGMRTQLREAQEEAARGIHSMDTPGRPGKGTHRVSTPGTS